MAEEIQTHTNDLIPSFAESTSSSVYSSSIVDSEDLADQIQRTSLSEGHVLTDFNAISVIQSVDQKTIYNATGNGQNVESIEIKNSKDIIIGNVTYITGPVYVTKTESGNVGILNQTEITETEEEDFDESSPLKIVSRKRWCLPSIKLAEPYEYLQEPAQYVVISHTASESSYTKPESCVFLRNIQAFHINSRRWNDIGYNFLIGCCGHVYEGRGWGVVGAHTYGYNRRAMGISFIGCFMTELPPRSSLYACQKLIEKGVEEGHISPDYKLLAHCQCSATESPGRMLYDVLKTWPHFTNVYDITNN